MPLAWMDFLQWHWRVICPNKLVSIIQKRSYCVVKSCLRKLGCLLTVRVLAVAMRKWRICRWNIFQKDCSIKMDRKWESPRNPAAIGTHRDLKSIMKAACTLLLVCSIFDSPPILFWFPFPLTLMFLLPLLCMCNSWGPSQFQGSLDWWNRLVVHQCCHNKNF